MRASTVSPPGISAVWMEKSSGKGCVLLTRTRCQGCLPVAACGAMVLAGAPASEPMPCTASAMAPMKSARARRAERRLRGMRVMVRSFLARGPFRSFWDVSKMDHWVILGRVQNEPRLSNGWADVLNRTRSPPCPSYSESLPLPDQTLCKPYLSASARAPHARADTIEAWRFRRTYSWWTTTP